MWEVGKTRRSCGGGKKGISRSQVNGTGGCVHQEAKVLRGERWLFTGGRTLPCTLLLAAVCSQDRTTAFRENNPLEQGRQRGKREEKAGALEKDASQVPKVDKFPPG